MKGSSMGHNRNDSHNPKLQVTIQPIIGIDNDTHQAVVKILNITLADEAVLSMKTRGAHWNVSGAGFCDRRALFDAQYRQLNDISDKIAERTRMLSGLPIGSFEEFLTNTRLDEQPGDVPEITDLLTDHEAVIRFLRADAKKCSQGYEDEITRDFLADILYLHEKMAWMLRCYNENEPFYGENQKRILINE
jgi:starvation-inducible DNA-binding protein